MQPTPTITPIFFSLPDNPFIRGILLFQVVLFGIWCWKFWTSFRLLRINQDELKKCSDIDFLINKRKGRNTASEVLDASEEEIFYEFCREAGLKQKDASTYYEAVEHLKTIFNLSWHESRLETRALLDYVSNVLLRKNSLLRPILSSFIVIGLLGTLIGLAASMAGVLPEITAIMHGPGVSNNMALGAQLSNIKGAFLPSIVGVLFTVTGIILFSFYLRFLCSPVMSEIERLTLTVWVPRLYPTPTMSLLETIEKSANHMKENVTNVENVAHVVKTVEKEFDAFGKTLSRANETADFMSSAAAQINSTAGVLGNTFADKLVSFADTFEKAVNKLSSFQADLGKLYKEMVEQSTEFQTNVGKTLNAQNIRLDNVFSKLISVVDKNDKKIEGAIKAMKSYEDAYIKNRQEIDHTLKNFIDGATESNDSISASNRLMVVGLSDKLESTLKTVSGDITQVLTQLREQSHNDLSLFLEAFRKLDTPIGAVANKIEATHENFSKRMDITLTSLEGMIRSQHDKYEGHLVSYVETKQRVADLLLNLNESRQTHSEHMTTLNSNMIKITNIFHNLSSDVGLFSEALTSLNRTVECMTGEVKTIGMSADRLNRITDAVTPLSDSVYSLSESALKMREYMSSILLGVRRELEELTQPLTSEANLLKDDIKRLHISADGFTNSIGDITVKTERLVQVSEQLTVSMDNTSNNFDAFKNAIHLLKDASQSMEDTSKSMVGLVSDIREISSSIVFAKGNHRYFRSLIGKIFDKAKKTKKADEIN